MRCLWFMLVLCILLLAACASPASTTSTNAQPVAPTSTPVATNPPSVTLPDFGTTTITGSEVQNIAARQQFLAAYQEGKPGRWEEISYTTEGDPISYQLEYEGNGTELRFIYDTTQDKFGSQQVTTYMCQQLIEDRTGLRLVGCGGTKEDLIIP